MNIRRIVAAAAATVAVVTSLTFGIAGPASASDIVIPSCAQMLSDPAGYPSDFAAGNGGAFPVAYHPSTAFYGTAQTTLKGYLHSWGARNCTWKAGKDTSKTFTISEVKLTQTRFTALGHWLNAHHIVGENVEGTMGGVLYIIGPHEWTLLTHGKVWITMIERHTSIFGYTMQSASYTLYDYNPSL